MTSFEKRGEELIRMEKDIPKIDPWSQSTVGYTKVIYSIRSDGSLMKKIGAFPWKRSHSPKQARVQGLDTPEKMKRSLEAQGFVVTGGK